MCLRVFEDLRRRITYRDGLPRGRRVAVFGPHPDDDVISMGGMLNKLVANGNEVTVAYLTNGSGAVFDGDLKRYLRSVRMSLGALDVENGADEAARSAIDGHIDFVRNKRPAEVDTDAVQQLKAHIRYAKAVAAIEVLNLHVANARFLDLPFYKTGLVRNNPTGEGDVEIVLDLLEETHPHHIFAAGDLSDPHGTHRMCYAAIQAALERYTPAPAGNGESNGQGQRPLVWLYCGAWQEWEIHRADVFLPMSKADPHRKIEAIFKHESQKNRAMFPGAYDVREFWQRARDRNRATARALDRLGLPEFYAAETYVVTERLP